MKKIPLKVGQYWAAAYNGNNGDLIVGRIESVRKNGKIILVNLLNDKTSTKDKDVLLRRNKRITKAQACSLQAAFHQTGDRQAVRRMAVEIPAIGEPQQELPLEPKLNEISRPSTATELNKNVQHLVQETNMKMQLVLTEFTGRLLDLVKESL